MHSKRRSLIRKGNIEVAPKDASGQVSGIAGCCDRLAAPLLDRFPPLAWTTARSTLPAQSRRLPISDAPRCRVTKADLEPVVQNFCWPEGG